MWIQDFFSGNTKYEYFDYQSGQTVSSGMLPKTEGKFIIDLNTSHLKLDKPLFISYYIDDGEYYVEQEQLDLWSRNKDLEKAVIDIKLQIVSLYCHLKKLGIDNLGLTAKQEFSFLNDYIK